MSHNTQTASNPANPDESVETTETVTFDLESVESVEKWLNGINWSNVVWPDGSDKSVIKDSLPVPDKSVIEAYNGANQSQKARIRTILTNVKNVFVSDMAGIQARNVQTTLDGLFTAKAAKAAIDPIVLIAARVANLREAANRLESGLSIPKGIASDIWDNRDMADLWAEVDNTDFDPEVADSIASAAIAKRSDKHDIQTVIDNAFNGLESGTWLSIAQIARRGASGDYKPGSGAIGAALFKSGGTPITGVTATAMTGDRPRGAVKD